MWYHFTAIFSKQYSFTSHLSRKHKNGNAYRLCDEFIVGDMMHVVSSNVDIPQPCVDLDVCGDDGNDQVQFDDDNSNNSDIILDRLPCFY